MKKHKKKQSSLENVGEKGGEVKKEFYTHIGNVKRHLPIRKRK